MICSLQSQFGSCVSDGSLTLISIASSYPYPFHELDNSSAQGVPLAVPH